ncbi:MAG TPA: HAD family hydrolase [Burkholderiaceae bacterium]|nr:HAD family hydrolase [Burkholderiaceae bacterium]
MTSPKNLALFDLDHTLLPMDSDYQWADFLARTGRVGDPVLARRRNDELMRLYEAGELTAERAAAFMLGLLTHAPSADLAEWHEHYMVEVVRPNIRPAAVALVRGHLERGDLCAIVTATNEFVTAPIARAFGIPHLIATIPQYRDGRYTGRISGVPSFQAGKVTRVNDWLRGQGLSLSDFETSRFYSDSINDVPLMEAVTDPVATNPSPPLRELAERRGWRVLDLFQEEQATTP